MIMPGPGGGGHGGGGGFHGGGGGGGFHGSPRGSGFHGGRHYYGGGFWHRPYYYGGGGGCLGGIFGAIMAIILAIIIVVVFVIAIFGSSFETLKNGGTITYNENKFQDYANSQYMAEFGSSPAYEDNILIVFLTYEDYNEYDYIAWVGDNIKYDINVLFGAEGTELGRAMYSEVNQTSYKYSLDSNLAAVMRKMKEKIASLGLGSSFEKQYEHGGIKSHSKNYTEVALSAETLDAALVEFTDSTGIPVVVVVEDAVDVFGKTTPGSAIAVIVIAAIVLIVIIALIIKSAKKSRAPRDKREGPWD